MAMQFVCYSIDADDVIVEVGGQWSEFAAGNGGPLPTSVVGKPLFDFIGGLTTRAVYRDLLLRVRAGQRVQFPFRCDGPDVIREMSMLMTPLPNGGVRFEAFLLATRPMPHAPEPAETGLVRVCSWCRRVDIDGEWRYPEHAVHALSLFERDGAEITHGICPDCADMLSVNPSGHLTP